MKKIVLFTILMVGCGHYAYNQKKNTNEYSYSGPTSPTQLASANVMNAEAEVLRACAQDTKKCEALRISAGYGYGYGSYGGGYDNSIAESLGLSSSQPQTKKNKAKESEESRTDAKLEQIKRGIKKGTGVVLENQKAIINALKRR